MKNIHLYSVKEYVNVKINTVIVYVSRFTFICCTEMATKVTHFI